MIPRRNTLRRFEAESVTNYSMLLSMSVIRRLHIIFTYDSLKFFIFLVIVSILTAFLSYSCDVAIHYAKQAVTMGHTFITNNSASPAFPALYLLGSSLLCTYIAIGIAHFCPRSVGSGVPELESTMAGLVQSHAFGLPVIACRFFGVIFAFAANQFVGKEGVTIAQAAAIAYQVMHLFQKKGSKHYIAPGGKDGNTILAAAAASGVSATFGTPIGGTIFSMEITSESISSSLLHPAFFTALMTTLLINLIDVLGICNLFKHNNYGLSRALPASYALGFLIAPLFGLLAALWVHIQTALSRRVKVMHPALSYGLMPVLSCCLCVSCVIMFPVMRNSQLSVLTLLFTDQPITELAATLDFGIMSTHPRTALLVVGLCLFFGSTIATVQKYPSGLFTPLFLSGALIGRSIGEAISPFSHISGGVYAMLGGAALVGSVTQTLSTSIIALELSTAPQFAPLVTASLIISIFVSKCFAPSIFKAMLRTKALPILTADAADIGSAKMPRTDVDLENDASVLTIHGTTTPPTMTLPTVPVGAYQDEYIQTTHTILGKLPCAMALAETVVAVPREGDRLTYAHILQTARRDTYPVVDTLSDGRSRLLGEISYIKLVEIVNGGIMRRRHRRGPSGQVTTTTTHQRQASGGASGFMNLAAATDFLALTPTEAPNENPNFIADLHSSLTAILDTDGTIDLMTCGIDTSPIAVQGGMRFSRLLMLTRNLQLKRVYVIDEDNCLQGVIDSATIANAAVN